jgi:hypothetical protein
MYQGGGGGRGGLQQGDSSSWVSKQGIVEGEGGQGGGGKEAPTSIK